MISSKYGLLNTLIDDKGNLPEPSVFRKRVLDLSDDDLRQILSVVDRLLLRAELSTTLKKVESLRSENHTLRRRLQNVMMQAELEVEAKVEHTPIDGNVNHVNYKTGKFKRGLTRVATKSCCDPDCQCFHCVKENEKNNPN